MGSEIRSPINKEAFSLVPMDLHDDDDEVQTLINQRKVCGWNYEMKKIVEWRDATEHGLRWMWWITVPSRDNDGKREKVGHIHLAAEASPPDPELAREDRTVLTVSTFFILPQYRKLGLGRAAWLEVENKAREIPECRQIAIDTADRRYHADDGPEWGGFLESLGIPVVKGVINEDWYARMGYTKFKTEPRYPLPNTDKLMTAVFMRKDIK